MFWVVLALVFLWPSLDAYFFSSIELTDTQSIIWQHLKQDCFLLLIAPKVLTPFKNQLLLLDTLTLSIKWDIFLLFPALMLKAPVGNQLLCLDKLTWLIRWQHLGQSGDSILTQHQTVHCILLSWTISVVLGLISRNLLQLYLKGSKSCFTESAPRPIQSLSRNVCLCVFLCVCLFVTSPPFGDFQGL